MPEDAVSTAVHRQEPVEMATQTMAIARMKVVVRRSVRASNHPKYLAELCSHEEMTCHVLRTRTSL